MNGVNVERLESTWESLISLDYLGWMNDRVLSDMELLQTGARDTEALFEGVDLSKYQNATCLELGCGVGRLLFHMAKFFKTCVGVDVSRSAITHGERILRGIDNAFLLKGNGENLIEIADNSIDHVVSFGVLTNMPVRLCCGYLKEVQRVLKEGGEASILFFIGEASPTCSEDALAYRVFRRENLHTALNSIGLSVEFEREFNAGIEKPEDAPFGPELVRLKKQGSESAKLDVMLLESLLMPEGEIKTGKDWPGSYTEYLLCVMRAKELVQFGDNERAKKILEHASESYNQSDPRILDLIQEL